MTCVKAIVDIFSFEEINYSIPSNIAKSPISPEKHIPLYHINAGSVSLKQQIYLLVLACALIMDHIVDFLQP
jgi:hypothetical protein